MNQNRQKVLDAIIGYIIKHQYPPSIREICDMTGLKSTSTVHGHIDRLLKEGLLETDHGIGAPRTLRVPGYKFVRKESGEK